MGLIGLMGLNSTLNIKKEQRHHVVAPPYSVKQYFLTLIFKSYDS